MKVWAASPFWNLPWTPAGFQALSTLHFPTSEHHATSRRVRGWGGNPCLLGSFWPQISQGLPTNTGLPCPVPDRVALGSSVTQAETRTLCFMTRCFSNLRGPPSLNILI